MSHQRPFRILAVLLILGLGIGLRHALTAPSAPTTVQLAPGAVAAAAVPVARGHAVQVTPTTAMGGNSGWAGCAGVAAAQPCGNPLQSARTILTQGYGVGSHAPANQWGAIDLAIDGDGDEIAGSSADLAESQDAPIYATHSGTVIVIPNSVPAGNHIWVTNNSYRTGYAHLSSFTVESNQTVERGMLIGYVGSTGLSSGPHLDYQIWLRDEGLWVNQNPLNAVYHVMGQP